MNLLLVPTEMECEILQAELESWLRRENWTLHRCGFGIAAAAANCSSLLARYQPRLVVLTGIAGVYETTAMVGRAAWFRRVLCDGIGVGNGPSFTSATQLGWPHAYDAQGKPIGDLLSLHLPAQLWLARADETADSGTLPQPDREDPTTTAGGTSIGDLITACTASSDRQAADVRKRRAEQVLVAPPENSNAPSRSDGCSPTGKEAAGLLAEDMEGFGVAIACRLWDTPLSIIRGLSNVVGDRRHTEWQVEAALRAAAVEIARLESFDERSPPTSR